MGTFHDDKHELHGITVVVDTIGDEILIGRCDDVDDRGVFLVDVDVHRDGDDGRTKAAWIERASRFGVWKKHDRMFVPADNVTSIRRLGDF